jgi:hypothetical protein
MNARCHVEMKYDKHATGGERVEAGQFARVSSQHTWTVNGTTADFDNIFGCHCHGNDGKIWAEIIHVSHHLWQTRPSVCYLEICLREGVLQ